MSISNLFDRNGHYITDERYKEILRLDCILSEAAIPHTLDHFMDGWQVCYPEQNPNARICDAVEHYGSYGNDIDRLELLGLLTDSEREWDSVVGGLTAEDVFNRIKVHYIGG